MAIETYSLTTYTAVSMREDLIDVIENISPVESWIQSNIGSTKALARYHEWTTDALAAAAANATIEGDAATVAAVQTPVRTGNYCQILRKVWSITDTTEAVNKAGRNSEVAYQTAKSLKELANDIEYAFTINAAAVSGATGTARQMCGLIGWITTNTSTGATGTGSGDITQSLLESNLQAVWSQGGKPSNVLCGGKTKRTIDGFTTNTRNVVADEKMLVSAVDVYQSSFGRVAIRLHYILNTTAPGTAFVLGDLGLLKKAWLRPIKKTELAKTHAATRVMFEAELTLECRQEKGHGRIYNLSTS